MMPSVSQAGASQVLPDKARLGSLGSLRTKTTPDSDALASSDDEHDMNKVACNNKATIQPQHPQLPARRTSWLDQVRSGPPRRLSGTSTSSNPSLLNPSEQTVSLTRTISNQGSSIATSTSPLQVFAMEKRIQEPFAAFARGAGEERSPNGGLVVRPNGDTSLPISIPLQPTPKTYRSLSYSVGQMEDEAILSDEPAPFFAADRQKTGGFPGSPYRPPHSSMLSQVSEGIGQASVEGMGSGGSPMSSEGGTRLPFDNVNKVDHAVQQPSYTIPRQATENAGRKSVSFAPLPHPPLTGDVLLQHTAQQYQSEQAIDDTSDAGLTTGLEEQFGQLQGLGAPTSEGPRRSHWQSSLDFGTLPEVPHSRRHSMADIPTRRNSLVAAAADESAMFSPSRVRNALAPLSTPEHEVAPDAKCKISSCSHMHTNLTDTFLRRSCRSPESKLCCRILLRSHCRTPQSFRERPSCIDQYGTTHWPIASRPASKHLLASGPRDQTFARLVQVRPCRSVLPGRKHRSSGQEW